MLRLVIVNVLIGHTLGLFNRLTIEHIFLMWSYDQKVVLVVYEQVGLPIDRHKHGRHWNWIRSIMQNSMLFWSRRVKLNKADSQHWQKSAQFSFYWTIASNRILISLSLSLFFYWKALYFHYCLRISHIELIHSNFFHQNKGSNVDKIKIEVLFSI